MSDGSDQAESRVGGQPPSAVSFTISGEVIQAT